MLTYACTSPKIGPCSWNLETSIFWAYVWRSSPLRVSAAVTSKGMAYQDPSGFSDAWNTFHSSVPSGLVKILHTSVCILAGGMGQAYAL